jgi:hypothetical protein
MSSGGAPCYYSPPASPAASPLRIQELDDSDVESLADGDVDQRSDPVSMLLEFPPSEFLRVSSTCQIPLYTAMNNLVSPTNNSLTLKLPLKASFRIGLLDVAILCPPLSWQF